MNKRFLLKTTSLMLSLLLVFSGTFSGALAVGFETESSGKREVLELSEMQLTAIDDINKTNRESGLVGFSEELIEKYSDNDNNIRVIIEFAHEPAAVQTIMAQAEGEELSFDEAEELAGQDYIEFKSELRSMFGYQRSENSYEITAEYTDAINGVAMTLPESKLEEIAGLESVWAVYPDVEVYQYTDVSINEDSNPEGMKESREYLDIDSLHAEGITGDGVVVGVIDTGTDYNHPDLTDAFSAVYYGAGDLQAVNGKYYGRNFVNNSDYDIDTIRSPYDPMETTYNEWVESGWGKTSNGNTFYTYHGTHVSGIIAADGQNTPQKSIGIAPDVALLSYRVLGPYGTGSSSSVLSAIDVVAADGCDVVNMSLGADINEPFYITSLAVNNVIISYDIVFAIASGNAGPKAGTVGTPGTVSLGITVGNGTIGTEDMSVTNISDAALARTSSRGPVSYTGEVKPDIVAPGTAILSAVPYYITNDLNKTNPTAADAYNGAYKELNGTSMASPHVAGAAALIKSQYSDMTAVEVKARITNTANTMNGYSVHEVGAGYLNPRRALEAESYSAVSYDGVALKNDNGEIVITDGAVSSVTFETAGVGDSLVYSSTRTITFINKSDSDKTYNLSYDKNHSISGDNSTSGAAIKTASDAEWTSIGADLSFDTTSVTVPANASADVIVTMTANQNIGAQYKNKLFEGYITAAENGNNIRLPFSMMISESLTASSVASLYKPAITSNSLEFDIDTERITYDSTKVHSSFAFRTDLYLTTKRRVVGIEVILASADAQDPADKTKHIGVIGSLEGLNIEPDEYFIDGAVNAMYTDLSDGTIKICAPGKYKVVVCTMGPVEYVFAGDLLVDNEAPDISVTNLSGSTLIYNDADMTKTTITGNIYDAGVNTLNSDGKKLQTDKNGSLKDIDQSANVIYAHVDGTSTVKAATVEANGDFSVLINDLDSSGLTELTLYGLDLFAFSIFSSDYSTDVSTVFSPTKPSFAQTMNKDYFSAFSGLNKLSKTITVKHDSLVISNPGGNTGGGESYTVSYSANGGNGSGKADTVTSGIEYEIATAVQAGISNSTETRKNMSFTGWNSAADGSGTAYEPSKKYSIDSDTVLYAQWENGGNLNTEDPIPYIDGFSDGTVKPGAALTRAQAAKMMFSLLRDSGKEMETKQLFSDVKPGIWYYQPINYLASIGVLEGYSDGTFKPGKQVTRAEFVKIISSFTQLNRNGKVSFKDVTGGWAYVYIATAYENGWIDGYSDNTFRPSRNITRAEAAKVINCLLGRKLTDEQLAAIENPYSDLSSGFWGYRDLLGAS